MKERHFSKLLTFSFIFFLIVNSCMISATEISRGPIVLEGMNIYNNVDFYLKHKNRHREKGPIGPTGATGPAGLIGFDGPTGATGPAGATGSPGLMGAPGPAGSTGTAGLAGPSGATGAEGAVGAPGATGPIGLLFGNYAYALNDGNTTTALSTTVLTFNVGELAGNISYNDGVFNLDNSNSLTPAVYLVNVGYSSFGSELDNGFFTIEVDINSLGVKPYGNRIYAVNGTMGGAGSTALVTVPGLVSAQLILSINGQINSDEVSITIIQIDKKEN